jgi:hypothetical protein
MTFFLDLKQVFKQMPEFKGKVSPDWGGLLMVLLDRYKVLDITA